MQGWPKWPKRRKRHLGMASRRPLTDSCGQPWLNSHSKHKHVRIHALLMGTWPKKYLLHHHQSVCCSLTLLLLLNVCALISVVFIFYFCLFSCFVLVKEVLRMGRVHNMNRDRDASTRRVGYEILGCRSHGNDLPPSQQ